MFGSFESTIIKTRIEGITKWFAEVLSIPGNGLKPYITMPLPTCPLFHPLNKPKTKKKTEKKSQPKTVGTSTVYR